PSPSGRGSRRVPNKGGVVVMVNGQRFTQSVEPGAVSMRPSPSPQPSPSGRGSQPLRNEAGAVVMVNGQRFTQSADPGTILTINREWHSGDTVTLDLPMPARVTRPIESAPGYCAIE